MSNFNEIAAVRESAYRVVAWEAAKYNNPAVEATYEKRAFMRGKLAPTTVLVNNEQVEELIAPYVLADRSASEDDEEIVSEEDSGKKTTGQLVATKLYLDGNAHVQRTLTPIPWNRAGRFLHKEEATVHTGSGEFVTRVENYTSFYLVFQLTGADDSYVLNRTIYRTIGTDNFYWENEFDELVDIVTGKKMTMDEIGEHLVYNSRKAPGQENLTAGQKKSYTIQFVCSNFPGINSRALKYILTYGASELLANTPKTSQKDLAQKSNRLAQYMAPNTSGTYLNNVCFFMGKIKDGEGNEYRDGFGFVLDEAVRHCFVVLSKGMFAIKREACQGLAIQMRPWLCKLESESVSAGYMNRFLELRGASDNAVFIYRDTVTEEQQKAFNLALESKGKKGAFAGKYVFIADHEGDWEGNEVPDFFTDINGLKAEFDLSMGSTFNILSMSHHGNIESGAHLSTQLVQSMMIFDYEATKKVVNRHMEAYVSSKYDELTSTESRIPTVQDVESSLKGQLLAKLCPAVTTKYYFPLLRSITSKTMEGMVRVANNLSIPTKGAYQKLMVDPAMDFGVRILNVVADETSNGILEVLAPVTSVSTRGIAVKYPKQHFGEYGKCRVLSVADYIARVNACDQLSDGDKELLIEKVRRLSKGVLCVPAIAEVKNMLAGMDFDGDAVILFLDSGVVSVMWKGEPIAVCIDENDAGMLSEEEYAAYKELVKKSKK